MIYALIFVALLSGIDEAVIDAAEEMWKGRFTRTEKK